MAGDRGKSSKQEVGVGGGGRGPESVGTGLRSPRERRDKTEQRDARAG